MMKPGWVAEDEYHILSSIENDADAVIGVQRCLSDINIC